MTFDTIKAAASASGLIMTSTRPENNAVTLKLTRTIYDPEGPSNANLKN